MCTKPDGTYSAYEDVTGHGGSWWQDYPVCGLIIRARINNYKP
jgi:hypothetical protein